MEVVQLRTQAQREEAVAHEMKMCPRAESQLVKELKRPLAQVWVVAARRVVGHLH